MTPAFLDANIPIYAAGRDHPLRAPSLRVLHIAATNPVGFLTDVEVIQELLHRYLALRLWPLGRESIREFSTIMRGRIEPLLEIDVETAVSLADRYPGLAARDLVHAAVMNRLGMRLIVSADTDFDRIEGVERLDPARIEEWAGRLG